MIILGNASSNFISDWISPPGDTISGLLEELNWKHAELAARLDYTPKHVTQLIKGNAPISEETALKLEKVLGSIVGFWLTREARYREALAKKKKGKIYIPT